MIDSPTGFLDCILANYKPLWKIKKLNSDKNVKLIDKLELTEPYILSVSVPHRINNPTNEVRVVFAVRTLNNEETFKFL